jgi:S1-C subfamily serine protease
VRNLIAVAVVAALFGVLLVFAGADLSRRSETNGAGSSAPQLVPQLIPPGTVQPPATSGNGNNPNSGTNPNNGTNPNSGSNSNGGANSDNGTTPAPAPQSAATSKLDVGVVDIDTRLGYQDARAAGTGMIITSSGEVLTNTHVISGATTIRVTVVSTGKSYDATVLGSDKTHDVALLKLKGASNLATVKLGDSAKVEQGDTVTAVGNAGGVGGIPSVSSGTVTGLNQSITVADEGGGDRGQLSGLIQTNASLEPGDSGGPLYNAAGEVIGMDTAADAGRRFQSAGSESYAIAIDNAEAIVKDIQEQRGSSTVQIGPRGFLGVSVDDNNGSNGPFGGGGGGTSETAGAVVADVLDGTPAAKAGLQAGDVITAIDGKIVDSNSALTDRLHGFNPGDKVKVTWTDTSGQSHTTTITLADGPVA